MLRTSGTAELVKKPESRSAWLIPLSARGPEALRATARSWEEFLAQCPDDVSLEEIAANAALRRTHHDHRLAVVAHSKQELAERLREFADGRAAAGVAEGRAIGRPPAAARLRLLGAGAAVVGDGPATAARGAGLPRRDRALRRDRATARRLVAARRADRRRVRARAWTSPRSRSPASSRCRWRWPSSGPPGACGPRPWWGTASARWPPRTSPECSAWKTRSASSTTAGAAWSWHPSAAGCSPPAYRPTQAQQLIAAYGDRVALAAVNSPSSVTLSGEAGPLEELAGLLEARGVFCRFLKVRYAFHSAQMDPIRDELLAALEGIRPRPATLPLFSTVTGRPIEGPELGPEYWWRQRPPDGPVRRRRGAPDRAGMLIPSSS